MVVVYNCDENFAGIFATSVVSLFENNRDVDDIVVYLIEDGVSENSKLKFQLIAEKYGRSIITVPMPDIQQLAQTDIFIPSRLQMSTCGRLFAAELLPNDVDKIIYVDCDTLFLNSISDLWAIDMGDSPVGMVAIPISKNHKRLIGMSPDSIYYNSGLMVANLKKWREINAITAFMDYMKDQGGYVPYPDEGVLNAVFEGKIRTLPLKYNVYGMILYFEREELMRLKKMKRFYSKAEYEQARQNPVLVHFCMTYRMLLRPWYVGSTHPYTPKWREYHAMTPWKDEPLRKDTRPPYKKISEVFGKISKKLPSGLTDWMVELFYAYLRPLNFYIQKQKHLRKER